MRSPVASLGCWSIGAVVLVVSAMACRRGPGGSTRAVSPVEGGICGAPQGWCWAFPRPMGVGMRGVWAAGPGDVWAVGRSGMILHHDGRAWTRVRSDVATDLVAVKGRGPGDAWAIGENGTILRLQKDRWEMVLLPSQALSSNAAFKDLLVLPNGEVWVVGGLHDWSTGQLQSEGCVVGHLRDGVWTFDTDEVACGPLERVWAGRGPDDVWAEGGGAVVHWNGRYLTKNPGQKPPPRRGVHGAASGWRLTLDGGDGALKRAGSPSLSRVHDFWAVGPDDVWAIEGEGLRHFDGRAWGAGPENPRPSAVAARSPADLWVAAQGWAADHHELWHFDGNRWSSSSVPRGDHEAPVALAAPVGGDVWFLTTSRLRRYDGRRWTTVKTPSEVNARALLVRSNDDVWVGGDKVLLHWDGKAVTSHPITFDVRQLWGDGDELWAAPPVQRWNGSAFVPVPELNTAELKTAQVARAGDALWLIAGDKLARWQGGKVALIPVNRGELKAIHVGSAGDLWLAAGPTIVHGQAGASPAFQQQDSVGLRWPFALGGGGGLLWAIGESGLLLRDER